MTEPKPDVSPLLPDDATLKARRAALVDAVGPGGQGPQTPWRRRDPRLALGAATALAVIAVALIVGVGGDHTTKAFAVEPQDGGGVTIRIYSLSEAAGLEGALEKAGIRAQVTWLPAGMICREPHYTPSIVHLPGGGSVGGMTMGGGGDPITIGVGSTQRWRESFGKLRRGEISEEEYRNSTASLNLDPKAFRPDQSVVIAGAPVPHDGDPEGGSITKIDVAEGPVSPCQPVPALPAPSPFGLSAGGGPDYIPRGDKAFSKAAIASALRQAAGAAEASDSQAEAPPGPGQSLYTKTKVVQLQGWEPNGRGGGAKTEPRHFAANLLGPEGDALPALVPTLKEVWTAPDGTTRERETLGRVTFLSAADQKLWEEAGSPPPFAYDPAEHQVGRDSSGRPVKDFSSKAFRGRREFTYLSRLSRLPTEPEALRLTVENRSGGSPPLAPSPADSQRGGATVEKLLEILGEPMTSPALRAAAFNALAEIPGIGLERDVADAAGRRGDAISWVRERGFGGRFIFDPHTSEILSRAEMIFGPSATDEYGAPAGTPYRETAYLRSAIVDSR